MKRSCRYILHVFVAVICLMAPVSRAMATDELSWGVEIPDQWLADYGSTLYYHIHTTDNAPFVAMIKGTASAIDYTLIIHEGSVTGPSVGLGNYNINDRYVRVTTPTSNQDYYAEVFNASSGARGFTIRADHRPPEDLPPGAKLSNQSMWAYGDTYFYKLCVTCTNHFTATLEGTSSASCYSLIVHEGSVTGPQVGSGSSTGNVRYVTVNAPTAGQ